MMNLCEHIKRNSQLEPKFSICRKTIQFLVESFAIVCFLAVLISDILVSLF